MSSSCSTEARRAPDPIGPQVADAFDVLARDARATYRAMVHRLGAVRVRITVDDETFDIECGASGRGARVALVTGDAHVHITTSRACVRDVLAGRRTLAQALRDGSLAARGTLRDLVAVLGALEAFVHGAVRSREMAARFADFQTERVA